MLPAAQVYNPPSVRRFIPVQPLDEGEDDGRSLKAFLLTLGPSPSLENLEAIRAKSIEISFICNGIIEALANNLTFIGNPPPLKKWTQQESPTSLPDRALDNIAAHLLPQDRMRLAWTCQKMFNRIAGPDSQALWKEEGSLTTVQYLWKLLGTIYEATQHNPVRTKAFYNALQLAWPSTLLFMFRIDKIVGPKIKDHVERFVRRNPKDITFTIDSSSIGFLCSRVCRANSEMFKELLVSKSIKKQNVWGYLNCFGVSSSVINSVCEELSHAKVKQSFFGSKTSLKQFVDRLRVDFFDDDNVLLQKLSEKFLILAGVVMNISNGSHIVDYVNQLPPSSAQERLQQILNLGRVVHVDGNQIVEALATTIASMKDLPQNIFADLEQEYRTYFSRVSPDNQQMTASLHLAHAAQHLKTALFLAWPKEHPDEVKLDDSNAQDPLVVTRLLRDHPELFARFVFFSNPNGIDWRRQTWEYLARFGLPPPALKPFCEAVSMAFENGLESNDHIAVFRQLHSEYEDFNFTAIMPDPYLKALGIHQEGDLDVNE